MDSAMKLSNLCSSGGEAKLLIQSGQVTVNGQECTQRGKKLRNGDVFSYENTNIQIISLCI